MATAGLYAQMDVSKTPQTVTCYRILEVINHGRKPGETTVSGSTQLFLADTLDGSTFEEAASNLRFIVSSAAHYEFVRRIGIR